MSERSKHAGNSLLECTCRSAMPEILVNPAMIGIAFVSFIVFALYYMVCVREIRMSNVLPPHFIVTVYLLAAIGLILSLLVVTFIVRRNVMHTTREARLRGCMIGYLEARHADLGLTDRADLDRLIDVDAEIFASEYPVRPGRVRGVFTLLMVALVSTYFVKEVNMELGTVAIAMMVWMLAFGHMAYTSTVDYPKDHEDAFLRFYGIFREAAAPLGIEAVPYPSTVPCRSRRRMTMITVCTLGFGSLYWVYVMLRDMNTHFKSHRVIENKLIESIWILETGHAPHAVRS